MGIRSPAYYDQLLLEKCKLLVHRGLEKAGKGSGEFEHFVRALDCEHEFSAQALAFLVFDTLERKPRPSRAGAGSVPVPVPSTTRASSSHSAHHARPSYRTLRAQARTAIGAHSSTVPASLFGESWEAPDDSDSGDDDEGPNPLFWANHDSLAGDRGAMRIRGASRRNDPAQDLIDVERERILRRLGRHIADTDDSDDQDEAINLIDLVGMQDDSNSLAAGLHAVLDDAAANALTPSSSLREGVWRPARARAPALGDVPEADGGEGEDGFVLIDPPAPGVVAARGSFQEDLDDDATFSLYSATQRAGARRRLAELEEADTEVVQADLARAGRELRELRGRIAGLGPHDDDDPADATTASSSAATPSSLFSSSSATESAASTPAASSTPGPPPLVSGKDTKLDKTLRPERTSSSGVRIRRRRNESQFPPGQNNPPLLVLDLNNCILFRKERTAKGSKIPIPRPYLAPFLEFSTAVYSSARSYNVLAMLSALSLVPSERAVGHEKGMPWVAQSGDALGLVFTREMMGLNAKEFEQNVETVKDLEPVWKSVGGKWSAERTILLDDEPFKASLQPYNHLPIEPFFVQPQDVPPSPPASPRPNQTPASASLIFPNLPNDTALLSTAYILSILRTKSNVASFIRGGGLDPLRALGEEELAKRGELPLRNTTKWWGTGWFVTEFAARRLAYDIIYNVALYPWDYLGESAAANLLFAQALCISFGHPPETAAECRVLTYQNIFVNLFDLRVEILARRPLFGGDSRLLRAPDQIIRTVTPFILDLSSPALRQSAASCILHCTSNSPIPTLVATFPTTLAILSRALAFPPLSPPPPLRFASTCLRVLNATISRLPPNNSRALYGQWQLFFADSPYARSRKTLVTLIETDPAVAVRVRACRALDALLQGSTAYLAIAEDRPTKASFTSLSSKLGDVVSELHSSVTTLVAAPYTTSSTPLHLALLHLARTLGETAPYGRMRRPLAPPLVEALTPQVKHEDEAVATGAAAALSAILKNVVGHSTVPHQLDATPVAQMALQVLLLPRSETLVCELLELLAVSSTHSAGAFDLTPALTLLHSGLATASVPVQEAQMAFISTVFKASSESLSLAPDAPLPDALKLIHRSLPLVAASNGEKVQTNGLRALGSLLKLSGAVPEDTVALVVQALADCVGAGPVKVTS
ncbi:hypothetical protein RQP46_008340 [Phenoliferia psychrophenolica]